MSRALISYTALNLEYKVCELPKFIMVEKSNRR